MYTKDKKMEKTLIFRGILGVISLVCWYTGLRLLPLSQAMTLYLMTPFYTAFFGYILLGERIGIKELIFSLLAFCGILLIIKPYFLVSWIFGAQVQVVKTIPSSKRFIGLLCCFTTAVCRSMVQVIFRQTKGKVSSLLITHYFLVITAIVPPVLEFTTDTI
jgi:drug/metabolite transporter (DMT)-like permease